MNYFVIVNNAQQGPYTIDELRQRHITEETLVWCEGMTDWQPAWQVEELKPLFAKEASATQSAPPPIPHAGQQGATSWAADGATDTGNNGAAAGGQAFNGMNGSADQQLSGSDKGKPKSHRNLSIAIGITVVILFVLALTNPGAAEHRRAIDDKIGDASFDIDDNHTTPLTSSIMSIFSSFGKGVAIQMLKDVVDSDLTYHNYIFFSTTTVHVALLHKDIHTSTGFLGHVNAIDLTSILPEVITQQMTDGGLFTQNYNNADDNPTSDNTSDNASYSDTEDGQTADGADGATGSASKEASSHQQSGHALTNEQISTVTRIIKQNGVTIDSATKQSAMRIANELASKVKKEINKQDDSKSSEQASNIIDEVCSFLKSFISDL